LSHKGFCFAQAKYPEVAVVTTAAIRRHQMARVSASPSASFFDRYRVISSNAPHVLGFDWESCDHS
jgi:hypothetical protein